MTLILILALIIIYPFSLSYAQSESKEIKLRIGKHQDFYRIVLYLSDENIKNLINLKSAKDNKIRISIPREIQIEFNGKILSDTETINSINFKRIENEMIVETPSFENLKFYKLDSPLRFIIDIFVNQPTADESIYGRKFTIIIDPGHGGKDFGISKEQVHEKDIALSVAKELSLMLSKQNIKNFLTRQYDEYVPIKKRLQKADKLKSGIFFSIHVANQDRFIIYYYSRKEPSEDNKKKSLPLEKFISFLHSKIRKEFSDVVLIENMQVYNAKTLNLPFVLVEIPRKTLRKDREYTNKIVEILSQSIIELSDFKYRAKNG